jgi:hypothetical protein
MKSLPLLKLFLCCQKKRKEKKRIEVIITLHYNKTKRHWFSLFTHIILYSGIIYF